MGLPAMWMRVADEIGYEPFIAMWRICDADPFVEREPGARGRAEGGAMVLRLRSFRSYLRYQRNRYIESLAALGLSWRQIREKLIEELCETLSRRHITDLMKGK